MSFISENSIDLARKTREAREAAGSASWAPIVAKLCAEKGLKPRGALAYAPGVSPDAATRVSREERPSTPGALPWGVIVQRVAAEAGFGPRAGAQTSPRGAPSSPSFAAPHAGRASATEGGAPWNQIVARVSEEAGLTNKARGRANE